MLEDLSIEKLVVLAIIALFVLGPERLPGAVAWTARTVRRAKALIEDTQRGLEREIGPGLDELRQPLRELREPWSELRELRRPADSLARILTTPVPSPGPGHPGTTESGGSPPVAVDSYPPLDPDTT